MTVELLLMGGSHVGYFLHQSQNEAAISDLAGQYEPRFVVCTEHDFIFGLRIRPNGEMDCSGTEDLKTGCQNAFGQNHIDYRADRLIGLTMAGWHMVLGDPLWLTHYPVDLVPVGQQRVPMSTQEVIQAASTEFAIRLRIVKQFLNIQNKFFLIFAPPPSLFHPALVEGAPPATIQYVNLLCNMVFQAALKRLGIPFLDHSLPLLDPNGFLAPDMVRKYNDHHGDNLIYGSIIWNQLMNFLRRHFPPGRVQT